MKTIKEQILAALLAASCIINGTVLAEDSSLAIKWGGTWKNVESLNKRMPEMQRFKTVNIYDDLIITDVTAMGFNYRNTGNDVGYGPNEQTYSQGKALFTKDGNAEDTTNGFILILYQGSEKWDRGISIGLKTDNNKKIFKQIRTRFDTSFNCDKASTHIENQLCTDPVLARADKELGKYYRNLRKKLDVDEVSLLKKSQRNWIKKRDKNCQDKVKADNVCLAQHYVSRIVIFRKMYEPVFTDNSALIDHDFMDFVYNSSPFLWDDIVTQLIFKSQGQNEIYKQWMTFNPKIKATLSDNEIIFTGAFEYETIVWPDNTIIKKEFQWVINAKGQQWLTSRADAAGTVDTVMHFGNMERPESVLQWVNLKR